MARSATYLTILGSEPGKLVLPLNLNMLGTTLTLPRSRHQRVLLHPGVTNYFSLSPSNIGMVRLTENYLILHTVRAPHTPPDRSETRLT